ncbi:putative periplasmic serine endoprotease DegP-like protein [Roseibium aquae]|uniref:Probable periplasmic serine endoprotease DegP-like n=1 Tax=Roseibium aquae TaxID=1323746 RepID=A0A916TP08_9HYPH|nr:Do family serine endopeptidase [Roseibium aquae]GGB63143.1 putative periplasmic serine endoprotease DegP-like protein [Roseibium aquae]
MQDRPFQTQTRSFLKTRRGRLLAGAMALGLAGVMTAQTVVPSQLAQAAPVRVDRAAPADFSDVVQAVQPAVVSVRVKQTVEPRMMNYRGEGFEDFFGDLPRDHPFQRFFREFGGGEPDGRDRRSPRQYGLSQGSGFFISGDGYVVTNHHVIEKGTEFTVITQEGEELNAELIGADPRTDLALLKVQPQAEDFTYVRFADDAPMVGEWVVAIGNPFGLGGSVTAGIVSARGRDIGAGPYDDFIQIDAPVNRGNSGGPAFNMNGEVIGVNAAIFSPSGGNVGIAFAIPASTATDVIMDLKDGGTVTRGWLGVQIQGVTDDIAESVGLSEARGAIIAVPQEGSPAEAAGLRAGDIVLEVDGREIESPRELSRVIAAFEPDTRVDITVWRDGRERDVEVRLGRLEDSAGEVAVSRAPAADTSLEDLGLRLTTAEQAGLEGAGVVIADVDPGSPAAEKRLRRGDRIVEVAGTQVRTPQDVLAAIAKAEEEGRKAVLFRIESNENVRFVALPTNAA